MRNRRVTAAALLLLFAAGGYAQQKQTKSGPHSTGAAQVSPAQVATQEKPVGAAQEKPDYSEEPFVIEQAHTRVRFENNGTGYRDANVRFRVQSESGVQALGELVLGYNSGNERVEIDYVRVRKTDGSVVTASADAVKDLTAPVAREAPIYTDYRQKHISVPGLRPGEVLEYHLIAHFEKPLAPGHFWFEHKFEEGAIVLDEQLEVNVPGERALKLKTQPRAVAAVTDEGGRKIYRWTSSNLKRESEDEEKDKKKKKRREPEAPDVQLTTFPNWEEVGRWYAQLQRGQIAPNDAIRAKAAELTRGRTSEMEKIEALYDYVAKNFRYVSLSFGLGRYQPHAASEVLANQYGDCKDKHTLLAALLESVGVRADAALIHSARKIDADVPSPSQFDHVISAIPTGTGYLWLDTTTEVAPFRLISANLRGKQALVVPSAGAARLVETPPDPPFPSTQVVELEGEVSELGRLATRVKYTLRGDNELYLRLAFRRTPQTQWKQLGQWVAYADGLRGEVTDVKASDPAATKEPFQLEFRFAQANFLDWSSKKAQVRVPLPALGLPDADEEAEESGEPLELGTPLDITARLKLQLPARYTLRAPVSMGVARDYAEYRSSYKVEGNTVTVERILRFRARELAALRARDYLAFQRAVRSDEGQPLSLESSVAGTPAVPESAKADELYEAAIAALNSNNDRVAVDLLKRVVDKEPKHKTAWNALGSAYLSLYELQLAADAFRKQIEVNPYDEYAYNSLGRALWLQQKYDDAAEAFRKQIEINPLDKRAHASLGTLYVEWRKFAEAVDELEKAITLTPENAFLYVSLGQAYLNVGQTEKAMAAFDKGVELSPSPTIWNNVAYELSLHNASLDRAQQYAESAVATTAASLRNVTLDRLTPTELRQVSGLAAYWDTLGWIHLQRGDLDKAERYVRASWLLDFHGEVGDHLAQIYEKRGRTQEAIRTYAQALVATRPVPETRERLAKLVGGEDKVEALLSPARDEIKEMRRVKLGELLKEDAEAEFFIVLSPPPATAPQAGPKVEEVRFIRGSEKLRQFTNDLRTLRYPAIFPDDTPTKLVRRATLSCTLSSECVLLLITPDRVTSVN